MNLTTAIILLGLVGVLAITMYGLFNRAKLVLLGVIALLVVVLALLGAWYSWAESRSMPWTLGYATVAAVGLASAIRQLLPKSSGRD